MALGRHARRLTVGGKPYRWVMSRSSRGELRAIVQHADGGARLKVDVPYVQSIFGPGSNVRTAFGPGDVAAGIEEALRQGWEPGAPGADRRIRLPFDVARARAGAAGRRSPDWIALADFLVAYFGDSSTDVGVAEFLGVYHREPDRRDAVLDLLRTARASVGRDRRLRAALRRFSPVWEDTRFAEENLGEIIEALERGIAARSSLPDAPPRSAD